MCACGCGWIEAEQWLGPCISKGPMLIETCVFCVSVTHTHTLLYTLSTHRTSGLPQGALPGPSFNICKVGNTHTHTHTHAHTHTHTHTHTHNAFISPSPVTVSLCLGRKIGLCRAQRWESPKAARQIQLLQFVIPRFASHRSTPFKLHSLSPTSQLLTDGFLCLLHCV